GDQHAFALHAVLFVFRVKLLRWCLAERLLQELANGTLTYRPPCRIHRCRPVTLSPFETIFPEPDAEARAHSDRVIARIGAEIDAAGGWIPFSRYMELALYSPALGYYVAGASKFGRGGDVVTEPEMAPLFASALAVQVAAILDATKRRELIELGAGTGRLAADLLNALAARDALPSQYGILETSPDLRERQRITLARDAPAHL